jgi:23S rRNA (cytosine1962-C5)-methyltransferase
VRAAVQAEDCVKKKPVTGPERGRPHPEGAATELEPTAAPSAARLRLRITAPAESIVRGGHPWVFAESVREQNREGQAGELAIIYDRQDKFLAVGLFDPDSPIRVRVLHAGKPQTIGPAWWAARLDTALRRRDGLFDERTTGCRLINGESDGWPGLVLDRYDTTLVMKIYTAAWLPRLEEIVALICERLRPEQMILRMSRNIQSATGSPGFRSRQREEAQKKFRGQRSKGGNENQSLRPSAATGRWGDGEIVFRKGAGPEVGAPVVFLESGLRFEADVLRGQKTGFFLDQRENRRLVESLARGRTVLNAFSFSGGFSVYAARGGAKSVTDLDISAHALAAAERNFKLNETEPTVAGVLHERVRVDAFEWLSGNSQRKFDLAVLDPPSLARREAERTGAIRAYGKLAESGLKHLLPGGILVACSCSAHVTAAEFFSAVRQSAAQSGRKFVELRTTRHAPDHPATFAEAAYLKAIYLRLC